jgi:hypothetical protein
VIIGIDPHNASHTAVAIGCDEHPLVGGIHYGEATDHVVTFLPGDRSLLGDIATGFLPEGGTSLTASGGPRTRVARFPYCLRHRIRSASRVSCSTRRSLACSPRMIQ